MDEPNSRRLMDFKIAELHIAGKLLSAFRNLHLDRTRFLNDVVSPEKNPTSGFVFLIDSNFNVAMMNSQFLEDWHRCKCQNEGFFEDLKLSGRECCLAHLREQHAKVKAA